MGELILLGERMADRSRGAGQRRPAFFFDLACPFSYLMAERAERALGDVDWVPAMLSDVAPLDSRRRAIAERLAAAHRLPLVWPDSAGRPAPAAMRAASFASEAGPLIAARFAAAAGRLAFCGGFDLEDPETLAEAAAVAGLPLGPTLAAARDASRDAPLRATGDGLRRRGIQTLPVLAVGRRLLEGEDALARAAALLRRDRAPRQPASG